MCVQPYALPANAYILLIANHKSGFKSRLSHVRKLSETRACYQFPLYVVSMYVSFLTINSIMKGTYKTLQILTALQTDSLSIGVCT